MSLYERLEKIRQKPEPARRRILLFSTVIATVVIVGAWFLNLKLVEGGGFFREITSRISDGWRVLIDSFNG